MHLCPLCVLVRLYNNKLDLYLSFWERAHIQLVHTTQNKQHEWHSDITPSWCHFMQRIIIFNRHLQSSVDLMWFSWTVLYNAHHSDGSMNKLTAVWDENCCCCKIYLRFFFVFSTLIPNCFPCETTSCCSHSRCGAVFTSRTMSHLRETSVPQWHCVRGRGQLERG